MQFGSIYNDVVCFLLPFFYPRTRKLTTVPHEGRMKERKREKEGHDMNRHLGERERAKLLFLLTCVLLDTRKN